MFRFSCFSILFLLAMPLFAQNEPLEQGIPRDPAPLQRMKEQLSLELQQTQRMLGMVSPEDTQTIDFLTKQQAELTKQLRDITQQIQASESVSGASRVAIGEMKPDTPPIVPGMMGAPPMPRDRDFPVPPGQNMPAKPTPPSSMPNRPDTRPDMGMPGMGGMGGMGMPNNFYPVTQAYPAQMPPWMGMDQERNWDPTSWGPKLPKELSELKQSVESLQKEVADLKSTIKALETQIQLLSRNILLSEKVKESGN